MAQRIAVITGGMGGLGESISTKMHDAGYRVVVTYSPGNTNADNWVKQMKARDYNFYAFPVRCRRLRFVPADDGQGPVPGRAGGHPRSTMPALRAT